MSLTITPSPALSPGRRLLGRLVGLVAIGLTLIATVLAIQNLAFHLSTQAVAGEVVAVQPVPSTGRSLDQTWQITVEFADNNGQYRRFDQTWSGDSAPAKGDDLRVWFTTSRPADARVADLMQLWWQTVLFAAAALVAGIAAEELVRRRPRR